MDSTFLHIVLTILTVAVLWGAYELYQIREELKYVRVKQITDQLVRQAKGSPLFDQENHERTTR